MAFDIRPPRRGASLQEVESYLFQLVERLNFVLNAIDTASSGGQAQATTQVIVTKNSSSGDGQATFNAIKGLIVKSADIVEAYYEEIKERLNGIYVAESDFGTYIQQTAQDIENNSTAIERNFTNTQAIAAELADGIRGIKSEVDINLEDISKSIDYINHSLVDVTANIRSGLLYYDENEIPVYGLEVGQRTMIDGVEVFDKYARFTSDRLSFFDQNDNEVAYISDRKLYINHVEVRGSFKMGGFVRTVLSDGSIVKRWVDEGGEG